MLSDPIRESLAKVEAAEEVERSKRAGEHLLEGSRLISKAATFYEKVRYLVDYRDEHTIRRAAVERILKRYVMIEQRPLSGLQLLQELANGQYIQKEMVTDEAGREVDGIVVKFLNLNAAARVSAPVTRKLLSFAATEVDATLSPIQAVIDHEMAEAFYNTMHGHISAPGLPDEVVNAQLYCACWRALLAADNDHLAYALWLLYMPEWKSTMDLLAIAPRVESVVAHIISEVTNSLQWQIAQKMKNESIYFRIIREVVLVQKGGAAHTLEQASALDAFARDFLDKKYEIENERIRASGIRAVLYLFLTKMAVALAVEAPYEAFILGGINYFPLGINILFHPLLLFTLTRRVGSLDEDNTEAIIKGIHGILYDNRVRMVRVRTDYTRLSIGFGFLYLILFFFVFGAVIGFLELLGFNPVSVVLFLFFLALVSYFAFRIRYQAQRWKIIENQGTFALLANVLAIPIVRTGRWLSQTFSSINIFVLILDFIIETPFKRLLHFSNQFLIYLREKSEEMR